MAVEFPDDLAIPHDRRVERIETAPVDGWRAMRRARIQVPIHRITEVEPAVTQQIETSLADFISLGNDLAAFGGPRHTCGRRACVRGALEEAQTVQRDKDPSEATACGLPAGTGASQLPAG